MGSTSFWGFLCPDLLLVFLNFLLFLGTCIIFFRKCWDFLWVFSICFSVPYFGLDCDHGNSFLCLDRGQNGFQCEDNNNNTTTWEREAQQF